MSPVHKSTCERFYHDFKAKIATLPGSWKKHHAWIGGYYDHIEESMRIAILLHDSLPSIHPLSFTLSEALFCLFFHDFDKLFRYRIEDTAIIRMDEYSSHLERLEDILIERYGYKLSLSERNALEYVHGEGKDHNSEVRMMEPLAAFIHCCDIISARIWHDYGAHKT